MPALGRFLSPDPIFGGSANPYEYAAGDPVNNVDLTGEKCAGMNPGWIRRCKLQKEKSALRRANKSGALVIKITQSVLERLRNHPLSFQTLQDKAGEWELKDLRDFGLRAGSMRRPRVEPIRCSDVNRYAEYVGGFGLIAGVIPGGQAFAAIVGAPAGAVGLGTQIASDSGWC